MLNFTAINLLEETDSSTSKAENPDKGGSNFPRNAGAFEPSYIAIL
jgi:hypothetical protein